MLLTERRWSWKFDIFVPKYLLNLSSLICTYSEYGCLEENGIEAACVLIILLKIFQINYMHSELSCILHAFFVVIVGNTWVLQTTNECMF